MYTNVGCQMWVKGSMTQSVQYQARPTNSRHSPAFMPVYLSRQAPLFQLCHSCCLPSHSVNRIRALTCPKRLFFRTKLLFSQLQFIDWVYYAAHKHRAGTTGRAATWEEGGGEQVKPALNCVPTQKTVCAPTFSSKGLLLVLLHITSIHPENILRQC